MTNEYRGFVPGEPRLNEVLTGDGESHHCQQRNARATSLEATAHCGGCAKRGTVVGVASEGGYAYRNAPRH